MTGSETRPQWPAGLMLGLSIFIIIFGIVTICFPSLFWNIVDVILGFFLFAGGISAVINAFKNRDSDLVWILGFGGLLLTLIGIGLMFSRSHLVGTIMIWIFALWALIRGVMLIIYGINNKAQQPMRWGIVGLGCLLLILAIIIICVPKSESRAWAGVCIGISTLLDGISLLFFSIQLKNNPSLQTELVNQADQSEIAQGDVVVTQSAVEPNSVNTPENSESQPNNSN